VKIEYLDNACCVYSANGFSLLADPWLTNGAFEGSWYHQVGALNFDEKKILSVDALYISHLHPDHFDPAFLKKFRKSIPVIVLDKKPNFLHRKLQELGFYNLVKVKDGETVTIGPFDLTMYAPFTTHPFDESVLGNFIDSAIVLEFGGKAYLNANDNTPTVETAKRLKEKHDPFEIAQLKYALAGPYPSCFLNLTDEEKLCEKERLLARQKTSMDAVVDALGAKSVMSFAGSYCLAGSLTFKNKFLAVDGLDLNRIPEGASYEYEKEDSVSIPELRELCIQARVNLWKRQEQFMFFPDYRFSIKLAEDTYISFNFNSTFFDERPAADLVCIMDPRLLRRILKRESHWNNAEIGCHIDFIREPNVYKPDIHTMFCFFHT